LSASGESGGSSKKRATGSLTRIWRVLPRPATLDQTVGVDGSDGLRGRAALGAQPPHTRGSAILNRSSSATSLRCQKPPEHCQYSIKTAGTVSKTSFAASFGCQVAQGSYQKPLGTYQILITPRRVSQKAVSGWNSRRPLSLAGRALPGRTRHPLLGERGGRGTGPRSARHLVAAGRGQSFLATTALRGSGFADTRRRPTAVAL
jgi:hypothetical protein